MLNSFCAKVLLFGEYSIVKGGRGLAAPLPEFCGKLEFKKVLDKKSLDDFRAFCEFMRNSLALAKAMDLERFKSEIEKGLYFESNIPQGAGIGSSGALCAALYDRYRKGPVEMNSDGLAEVLDHMALMESFYHGSSSGLDPLISYAQRPVLVENRNKVSLAKIHGKSPELYLIKTSSSRKTSPLVQKFLQMCEDPAYEEKVKEFTTHSNQAIEAYLQADPEAFEEEMYEISKWQFLNLRPMVCEQVAELWLEGIESKKFYLKLCGAGGGGHYLLYKASSKIEIDRELLKIKF